MKPKRIFIVAGEESSDAHGAALVRQLRRHCAGLSVTGYGGRRMSAAGVNVLYDLPRLAVVGFVEVLRNLPLFYRLYRRALGELDKGADLVILIDYPGFNLRLARAAKRRGIPVVYYISPQLWAWRPSRAKIIRECVDRMLVIFPFEVGFYKQHGVKAEFVGHPLLEEKPQRASRSSLCRRYGVPRGAKLVGLLPGSRTTETERLLRPMLKACRRLVARGRNLAFFLPLGTNIALRQVAQEIRGSGVRVNVIRGEERQKVRSLMDLALVASGTATLETGLLGTPMIILYRTSWLSYQLAKRLVDVRHIGMINILAGRRLVPEYIQDDLKPERIAREAERILDSASRRAAMRRGFAEVRRKLGRYKASAKAAEVITQLLAQ